MRGYWLLLLGSVGEQTQQDRTEQGYFTRGGCRLSLVSADGAVGGVLLLHSHAPSSGCDAHPHSGQCALGKEQGPPPGEQVTLLFISSQLIMGVGQRGGQEVVMVVMSAAGLWDQQAEGLLENLQQLLAP